MAFTGGLAECGRVLQSPYECRDAHYAVVPGTSSIEGLSKRQEREEEKKEKGRGGRGGKRENRGDDKRIKIKIHGKNMTLTAI